MNTVNIKDQRPPFVRFEMRAERDNDLSLKEGRPMFRDVPYVVVLQHGGKDEYTKRADEWLDQKHREAATGSYPPEWSKAFRHLYEEWKKGNDIPLNGTPVRTWPGASPAEVQACIQANLLTVEDLAQVPDGSLNVLGLFGRPLRDKARSYIEASKDKGQIVEMVASLKATVENLQSQLETERTKRTELEAALAEKRGPGRPRKEEAA